jgi:LacI family transcriptional regulator
MRDVARLAQVDVAIVSRVLRQDPTLSVRQETRERVRQAAAKLDYRPNPAARSLRTARASAYGLIIPDFHNTVYAGIIEGAQDTALGLDCALFTASLGSPNAAARKFADVLGYGMVDGLLVAGSVNVEALVQRFRDNGQPVLSVNRRLPGMDRYVVLDDTAAARTGVDHLLALGHTKIAHIAGPRDSDTAERRLEGYEAALASADVSVPMSFVAHAAYSPPSGYEAMRRLLAQDDRPTAVLVANVTSALGALRAIHEADLEVPDDISLVSVHDSDLAEFASPPLTVVSMPLYQLGARALELLAGTEPQDVIHEVVSAPLRLIVRQSTAPPRTKRPHEGS